MPPPPFFLPFSLCSLPCRHIVHFRVWPSTQRDSVLLSYIQQLEDGKWCVCNMTIDHTAAPVTDGLARTTVLVLFVAETVGETRDNVAVW